MTGLSTPLITVISAKSDTASSTVMTPLVIRQYPTTNKDITPSDSSCSSARISAYILFTSEVMLL